MTLFDENNNIIVASSEKQSMDGLAADIWNDSADVNGLSDSSNEGDFDNKPAADMDEKLSSQASIGQKRRFADVKPPYSYIALITMALESSISGMSMRCYNHLDKSCL